MEAFEPEHPLDTAPGSDVSLDSLAERSDLSVRDSHRGEPDALTVHVRSGGGEAQSPKLKLYATLGRKSLLYSPEVADGVL